MNHEFLYLLGMVMLCRLAFLSRDRPLSKRGWLFMSTLQLVFCLAFTLTWWWLALPVILFATNFLLYYLEHTRREAVYGLRFVTLLIFTIAFSIVFSAPLNPGFNPSVTNTFAILNDYVLIFAALNKAGWLNINAVIMGSLLVTTEINFFIRYVFSAFELIPRIGVTTTNEQPATAMVDQKEYNAGRFIGILERILIFFFVLVSQYTAIAFIIAAKGFTRFKDLDEREFAEYVLIGTLLSTTTAVLAALLVKAIIG